MAATPRRAAWQVGSGLAWGVLAAVLVVTLGAWRWVADLEEQRLRDEFAVRIAEVRSTLRERFDSYETILKGAAALFKASDYVTPQEWRDYVRALQIEERYPAIQALAFARSFTLAERPAIEAILRRDGVDDFRIWPAGERERYVVNVYVALRRRPTSRPSAMTCGRSRCVTPRWSWRSRGAGRPSRRASN